MHIAHITSPSTFNIILVEEKGNMLWALDATQRQESDLSVSLESSNHKRFSKYFYLFLLININYSQCKYVYY